MESITNELQGHFAIDIEGRVAGLLECHQETEPIFPSVAFDVFLAAEFHGRGYGRRALRLAIDLFVELGHHRFTIDPAVENIGARRAYEAVGFRPVGVLRQAERDRRGGWRDGLLMDLLAADLRPR